MTIVRIRGSPFLKSGLRICALRTTFQKWASRTLIINYIESVIFLREAEMDFPWDCLIFHDVDLLPLNDTNPYSCSKAQYYHALRLLSSLAVNLIIRTFFISIRTLFWWPPGKTSGNGSCHMQTILEELLQYPSSNTSRSSTSRFPCCVLSYFAHLSRPWSIGWVALSFLVRSFVCPSVLVW